jgi:hypothetical protein
MFQPVERKHCPTFSHILLRFINFGRISHGSGSIIGETELIESRKVHLFCEFINWV